MTGVHYAHAVTVDQQQGLHYSDFRASIVRKCLNAHHRPGQPASESGANPRSRVNGEDADAVADEFMRLIIATASGELAKNELNEEREIAIWKDGVTL